MVNIETIVSETVSSAIANDVVLSRFALIERLSHIAANKVCGEQYFTVSKIECEERSYHYGKPIGSVIKFKKGIHQIPASEAARILKACKSAVKKYI